MCDLCGCNGNETPCDGCSMIESAKAKTGKRQMQIGTIICDMHDGFEGITVTKHVVIETERSYDMLKSLCESKGIEAPHNKLAIVTGESRSGALQAAYSFDGVKFGIFEFTEQ